MTGNISTVPTASQPPELRLLWTSKDSAYGAVDTSADTRTDVPDTRETATEAGAAGVVYSGAAVTWSELPPGPYAHSRYSYLWFELVELSV